MFKHLVFSLFTLFLILGIWLISWTSPSHARGFPDVTSPLLQESVQLLQDRNILQGYPDGTFRPDQVINRAEALKMIFAHRGIDASSSRDPEFSDVHEEDWFYPYVSTAKDKTLIKGYADGTYRPHQAVNKAEFLKISMLAQEFYRNLPLTDHEPVIKRYSDIDPSQWYMPYVSFAVKHDYLDHSDKLSPTAGMTRAEAALIMARVLLHIDLMQEEHEKEKEAVLEKSLLRSCETCVGGVDFSQYDWVDRPFVSIEKGRLVISDEDFTDSYLKGEIDEVFFRDWVDHLDVFYNLKHTPRDKKLAVDLLYPQLYSRALGIHSGFDFPDGSYFGELGSDGAPVLNKDDEPLKLCACNFEVQFLFHYNYRGGKKVDSQILPFEEWLLTDEAKPVIYDAIYIYLLMPDHRP